MKRKLKTLLLSALLLGMPLWAGAQITTTVAGGTTDSYLIPLQYLNASYAQWSQSIYPASYLTSLVGTQFTSFTYYVSYNGTAPDPGEYTISLGITTQSDLAAGKDNTPTTQVFSGRPTIDGNALTFTFSQPFTYTGGNLLVYFDHQAGTTTTSESIPFNSISLSKASRSARNNASTTAYNSEGAHYDYLPTIAITATEAEPLTLEQSILYWVGEGSQKAYFVLDMGSESRAWGYRYDADDEPTALQMITAIDAADPRFAYTISWSTFEMSFHYADYPIHFTLEQYAFTVNDDEADAVDEFSDYDLADGMVVRVGAVGSAFNAPITPATVVETPEDASIDASDIVYWVGTGSNSAVLAINWAVPDTALAWGLRFDGDLTVAQALDYVAAADSRLSTNSYHSFINYTDGTVSLNGPAAAPAGSWNTHQFVLDGNPNAGWSSTLADGSFLKIGESFYGIGIDSTGSSYGWYPSRVAWPTKITPVSDPNAVEVSEIDPSQVQYFVGEGEVTSYLVMHFNTEDEPVSMVWGYRHDGTATALDMLSDIDSADSRLSTIMAGMYLYNYYYTDDTYDLPSFVNPSTEQVLPFFNGTALIYEGIESKVMGQGDRLEYIIADDFVETINFATTFVYVSDPNRPTDATIAQSDILYWVGTGSNSMVMAVSWADTALAWGYRFDGNATTQQVLDDIAAADPRFSYETSTYGIGDILFTANGVTHQLSSATSWWSSYTNGYEDMGASQSHANGDFLKWADNATGIAVDSTYYGDEWGWGYTKVWTRTIYPVSIPEGDEPNQPTDATIAQSDILYWVGTGSNSMVMAVSWADTALAWGYRFDGDATTQQVLDDIAAADPRFSYETSTYGIGDILFTADGVTHQLSSEYSWWSSYTNGYEDMGASQSHANGDFLKWADNATGVVVDSIYYDGWGWGYTKVWTRTVYPVSIPEGNEPEQPTDATIAQSDILYWVGTGSNSMVMAVSWADTALAWGYRFDGDATTQQVLDDIAAADPRFSYETSTYGIGDILFTANGVTYQLSSATSWWSSYTNGYEDMGASQTHDNGDFLKWADNATGVVVDSTYYGDEWGWGYTKVWTRTVYPVSIPAGQAGPFCGIVGTEGCNAIAADSSAIVAWATGCTLTRGPQNIAIEGSPLVTYGSESDAIGSTSPLVGSNMTCVSLGDGGSALLTFARPIRNGEGPDFAVFENSFNDSFLELAFVEVSSDGERFVRFPATSLTQTETQVGGMGSLDATMINNLAGKFRNGYGTPFDLEELADSTGINIDSIVYVRIVDVVGSINPLYATYDHLGNMVNDPWPTNSYSSGFDLSAVAVMYELETTQGIAEAKPTAISLYPNPASTSVSIVVPAECEAQLFDFQGRLVRSVRLAEGSNRVSLDALAAGVYMVRTLYGNSKLVVR